MGWASARPDAPFTLDSYAAPITSSGGSYPPAQKPIYGVPPQQAVIHKHVYVHVPPPEPPVYGPPRSHPPPPPYIPPPSQDEQKTLIYVLVKKPEPEPEIHIPTPPPTPPSKPEVYFIRYRTKTEVRAHYIALFYNW